MNRIKEVAYELYKQDWIDTNTTRQQRLDDIRNWAETEIELTEDDKDLTCSYEECREEFGYAGTLYVCFNEFLEHEYKDEKYIEMLLNSKILIDEYKKDIEIELEQDERDEI